MFIGDKKFPPFKLALIFLVPLLYKKSALVSKKQFSFDSFVDWEGHLLGFHHDSSDPSIRLVTIFAQTVSFGLFFCL